MEGYSDTDLDTQCQTDPRRKGAVCKEDNQGLTPRVASVGIQGHFKYKSDPEQHLKLASPLQERASCLLLVHNLLLSTKEQSR